MALIVLQLECSRCAFLTEQDCTPQKIERERENRNVKFYACTNININICTKIRKEIKKLKRQIPWEKKKKRNWFVFACWRRAGEDWCWVSWQQEQQDQQPDRDRASLFRNTSKRERVVEDSKVENAELCCKCGAAVYFKRGENLAVSSFCPEEEAGWVWKIKFYKLHFDPILFMIFTKTT